MIPTELYTSSDPAIESVPPKKRKCLFPHEQSLDLFESYTFSNCQLECSLQQAANTTRCLPWFLPRPALSMLTTCDPWQSTRFLQEVTSTDQAQCGHCLSDCDDVKYSVMAASTKLE